MNIGKTRCQVRTGTWAEAIWARDGTGGVLAMAGFGLDCSRAACPLACAAAIAALLGTGGILAAGCFDGPSGCCGWPLVGFCSTCSALTMCTVQLSAEPNSMRLGSAREAPLWQAGHW